MFYFIQQSGVTIQPIGGLSVHCQLHITLLMLCLPKIVNVRLNLLKLLFGILSVFFHLGYSKNGIFDDVIITSALHNDIVIEGEFILIKWIFWTILLKIMKIFLDLQRYVQNAVDFFSGHGVYTGIYNYTL